MTIVHVVYACDAFNSNFSVYLIVFQELTASRVKTLVSLIEWEENTFKEMIVKKAHEQ